MSILTDKKVMMNKSNMRLVVKVIKNVFGKDLEGMLASEGWEVCMHLDKALGVKLMEGYKSRTQLQDEPMPDEWVEFFEKLAGPHGKTILKMYQAKRGLIKCRIE